MQPDSNPSDSSSVSSNAISSNAVSSSPVLRDSPPVLRSQQLSGRDLVAQELAELANLKQPVRLTWEPLHLQHMRDEIGQLQVVIERCARREGLDFFDTHFQLVNDTQLHSFAAYGGFPVRYPHFRFGLEYEQLTKSYEYGLMRIYEMVINTDACIAYLLTSNSMMDQKLVMCHVYGHCDFFKNNLYFAHTNRKMLDQMGDHAARIERYVDQYGQEKVEKFLDVCLSVDNLIDIHSVAIKRHSKESGDRFSDDTQQPDQPGRYNSRTKYMESFINPPEVLAAERERLIKENQQQIKRFPERPERDILKFLIENAPLEHWQRDILSLVRDESYYFYPQGQTKIMNEGWASYWHSTLMTKYMLKDSEVIDYADHHSGTVATHGKQLNPYKLGIELMRDIEDRWNKGQFGPDWDNCKNLEERTNWDKKLGLGRQKLFEVRTVHNDLTFLDTFLTPEFCIRNKMFSFGYDRKKDVHRIESREFDKIKEALLRQLTNMGQPTIELMDANYLNRSELLLRHEFETTELDMAKARETLKNVQTIWNRPVHIETVIEGKKVRLTYDGNGYDQKNL